MEPRPLKDILESMTSKEPADIELVTITDSEDQAIEIIRTAPVSEWWRDIN